MARVPVGNPAPLPAASGLRCGRSALMTATASHGKHSRERSSCIDITGSAGPLRPVAAVSVTPGQK
jgi:hypothetical protein